MRFVSKNANLLIVLRPGLSSQPLTGTPARSMLSVRFKDGVADVPEGELVDMMLKHPSYNSDFVSVETPESKDVFASNRQDSEPAHTITELKFGTPVSRETVGGTKKKLSLEMEKLVKEAAVAMAKEMLPGMLEAGLKELVTTHVKNKKKTKGRPGRKPVKKVEELAEEEVVEEEVVLDVPIVEEVSSVSDTPEVITQ